MGKTQREFRRHILKHIGDIEHACVACHMREFHADNLFSIKFCAVEIVRPTERRRDVNTCLLQKKTACIYCLKTLKPGLNKLMLFTSFI